MPTENSLKNIIISGIFVIPFIGLFISSAFYFPYITPKNLLFRLIVLILSVAYAYLVYKNKVYRPSFGTIGWSFVAFICILFLADIFGQYSLKSFFSNFERMEGFFTILLLFFYFTVLTGVMKTERLWENLLNVSLASSVVMAVYALAEQSRGVDRLASQLGNSTYLGAFMLFNIFFALFLVIRHLDRKDVDVATKWLKIGAYGIITLLNLYVFYHTGTRGALLGLLTGLIFASILFAFFEKHNRTLKYTGYTILIVAVLFVAMLFSLRDSAFVKNSTLLSRFSALIAAPTDLSKYASTEGRGRFAIWGIALHGVEERPILGWGQENFNYVFNKYYDPKIYDQEQWFDRAHNVFFDWLVAGGIFGLASYLSMFGFTIYVLWRKKRENTTHHFSFADKTILTALLIAYFIHNFFVFDSITSYILFFTVLAYVSVHEKSLPLSSKLKLEGFKNEGAQSALVGLFSIASVIGLYYLVINPYIASTNLIQALQLQNTLTAQASVLTADQKNSILTQELALFKTTTDHGIIGGQEAREQLLQTGSTVYAMNDIDPKIKASYVEEIDTQLKEQLAATPDDARYFLFYGSYLARSGRFNEAAANYKKAEELSPNKPSLLIEEGLAYVNAGQNTEGTAILKRAFDLAPANTEARMLYAVGLIYSGSSTEADTILAPIKETDIGTDLRLIRAYYDKKDFIRLNNVLQTILTLAQKELAAGNKAGAISKIQEVMSINPAFQKQGEALITQINASK